MALELHYQSVEDLYIPIRSEHPTTGEVNLSVSAVAVALPAVGVAPTTWVTLSWATGTIRRGDDRYYVVVVPTSSFTFVANTSYQAWVRVGGVGGSITKAGVIQAITT